MRLLIPLVLNITAFVLLSACGGSRITTIPAPTTDSGDVSFDEALLLLARHADPVSYTSLSDIPTTGTATFVGLAYGNLANTSDAVTDSLIGELDLHVAFGSAATTFSGEIGDFLDGNNDRLSGTLQLGAGTFDRSGSPSADPTIGIAVTGNLVDTNNQTLAISARLEGDFLGSSYTAVGGEFLGSVTVSSQQQNLDGGFIAER